MSLSSRLAASRLIQPGVIPNSAARPASPFTGQCIYQTDTNQLLVWNGSAWVIPNTPAQNPTGMELVATNTFSGATNPFINGCFTQNYDNYKMLITWYGSVATNMQLRLRYGASTTQSGNQYYRYGFYYSYGGSLVNFQASNETQQFVGNHGTTAGVYSNAEITMFNPNAANQRTLWNTYHFDAQGGLVAQFTSQYADTTQYTGFEFVPTSGTVTGTVRVYGLRNS